VKREHIERLSSLFPFLAAALLSEGMYLTVFTRPFPLARWYATIPPVDYAKLTGHSVWWTAAFVLGIVVLFGLYLWAMALPLPPLAPYSGLVFAATLFFGYPLHELKTKIDAGNFLSALRNGMEEEITDKEWLENYILDDTIFAQYNSWADPQAITILTRFFFRLLKLVCRPSVSRRSWCRSIFVFIKTWKQ